MSATAERLRRCANDASGECYHICRNAADRIETLEAKLTACYQMDSYKRIEALEAALRCVIDNVETGSYESTGQAIDAARAEIERQ